MKKSLFLLLFSIFIENHSYSQAKPSLVIDTIKIETTEFFYHHSDINSKSVVIMFHDWFGVSDLSLEMGSKLNKLGYDVIIMDLYKGKTAKTNEEAAKLMTSIDQVNVWGYIDKVITNSALNYKNVYLWGFSLGTIPASNSAIKNNSIVNGLILFYGNVTQDSEQLTKITFPTLMIMGGDDNPNGAINYYNSVKNNSKAAGLFIYPNAKHAFAQKLFNKGANYDKVATEESLRIAFNFLKNISNYP